MQSAEPNVRVTATLNQNHSVLIHLHMLVRTSCHGARWEARKALEQAL